MYGLYDQMWQRKYGQSGLDEDGQLTEPAKTWLRLLRYARVTPEAMTRAFAAILATPPKYPPTPSEFIKLCVVDAVVGSQRSQGDDWRSTKARALPNVKRRTEAGIEALASIRKMLGLKP